MKDCDNCEKRKARAKRGETSKTFVAQFSERREEDLIRLLGDQNPQVRTAAAKILGARKSVNSILSLCKQLQREKALYAKIAISEALSSIGVPALDELLKLIGKIGNNQHQKLPQDIFKKWNYPCPRDIIIRTIVKMRRDALNKLIAALQNSNENEISEIVDAIGHISFYSGDQSSFSSLRGLLKKYRHNPVVVWKIIRAFQSFKTDECARILNEFLSNSNIPQHRWEAARSLGQIGAGLAKEFLVSAPEDDDQRVNQMVRLSLERICAFF